MTPYVVLAKIFDMMVKYLRYAFNTVLACNRLDVLTMTSCVANAKKDQAVTIFCKPKCFLVPNLPCYWIIHMSSHLLSVSVSDKI